MKKIFAYLLLCIICMASYGQKKTTAAIKNLSIGEKVPDISFATIKTNNRIRSLKISDFRGKLVIFDFWASYCIGCIKAFPRLDSLQKRFGQKIKIILVNQSPQKRFDDYMALRKKKHQEYFVMPSLLSINDDKLLSAMFRHNAIPHDVWVDPSGKVTAITEGYDVTATNIAQKLKDPNYPLPQKIDWLEFDFNKPIVPQMFATSPNPLKFYSAVTDYKPGCIAGAGFYETDSLARTIRITRNPSSILMLYAGVLGHWANSYEYPFESDYYDYGKRVVLEVSDSSRYIQPRNPDEQFKTLHWFGYESVRPIQDLDSIDAYTLSDFNRFFGVDGRMEKRVMKTIAIIRTSDNEKFKSTGNKLAELREDTTLHFRSYDINMPWLRNKLAEVYRDSSIIFWDNTNYKDYLDIELNSDLRNFNALRLELQQKYDLDLIEKYQPVDVMVISEKKLYSAR